MWYNIFTIEVVEFHYEKTFKMFLFSFKDRIIKTPLTDISTIFALANVRLFWRSRHQKVVCTNMKYFASIISFCSNAFQIKEVSVLILNLNPFCFRASWKSVRRILTLQNDEHCFFHKVIIHFYSVNMHLSTELLN